jgi:hypothetical protein
MLSDFFILEEFEKFSGTPPVMLSVSETSECHIVHRCFLCQQDKRVRLWKIKKTKTCSRKKSGKQDTAG